MLPSCTSLTFKLTKLQSKEEELSELTVELTSTNPLHPTLNWSSLKEKKPSKRLLKRRLLDCLLDKEVELPLKSVFLLKLNINNEL